MMFDIESARFSTNRHRRNVWLTIVLLFAITFIALITLMLFQHANFRAKHWWSLVRLNASNSSSMSRCANTEQGPELLSDDHGYVCRFDSLSPIREGCCDATIAPRFSCHSCNGTCCAIFEFCGKVENCRWFLVVKFHSLFSFMLFESEISHRSEDDKRSILVLRRAVSHIVRISGQQAFQNFATLLALLVIVCD
jgi:hypothetical protein